jgi:hypothetical protein
MLRSLVAVLALASCTPKGALYTAYAGAGVSIAGAAVVVADPEDARRFGEPLAIAGMVIVTTAFTYMFYKLVENDRCKR